MNATPLTRRALGCVACATLLFAAAAGCDEAAGDNAGAADTTSDPFSGTFLATVDGNRCVLDLQRDADRVTGRIGGLAVTATVAGDTAGGPLIDPDSGASAGTFELSPSADGVVLRLTVKHPDSGELVAAPPVAFSRQTAAQLAAARAADNVRDPALVGRWRHTWAQGGGGYSVAVDDYLILSQDGASSRDGVSAGGSADVSVTAPSTGESDHGRWRTEHRDDGKFLFVSRSPNQEPQLLARYYVDEGRMLLTYPNGSKEVWERL